MSVWEYLYVSIFDSSPIPQSRFCKALTRPRLLSSLLTLHPTSEKIEISSLNFQTLPNNLYKPASFLSCFPTKRWCFSCSKWIPLPIGQIPRPSILDSSLFLYNYSLSFPYLPFLPCPWFHSLGIYKLMFPLLKEKNKQKIFLTLHKLLAIMLLN